MRENDFFIEVPQANPFAPRQVKLDNQLIRDIHAGSIKTATDVEIAVGLARLVHDEYLERGTSDQPRLTVVESRAAMSSLRSVLKRCGLDFDPPFHDFDGFYRYWKNNGGSGSWQARRHMLEELFDPIHDKLADLEAGTVTSALADPITSRPRTGWTLVDEEIAELRRHFQSAESPQDYRNVGNDCVIVFERLSAAAYVVDRHLFEGEEEPPVASTKNRLERVVEVDLPGKSNAALRKVVKAAIENAQSVKHSTPDRLGAGIAADSVILLANMLRRMVP